MSVAGVAAGQAARSAATVNHQGGGYPQGYQGYPQGYQGYPQGYQGYPQGYQGYPQGQQGYPPPKYDNTQQYDPYGANVYGKSQSPPPDVPPNPYDVNNPIGYGGEGEKILPSIPTNIRHAFVRKVYCILALQLAYTFGFACIFTFVDVAKQWLQTFWWVPLIFIIVGMILVFVVTCFPQLGRSVPTNFILLTCITMCMSWLVALGGAVSESWAFAIAAGITLTVTVGLTIFAIQTKWDFTGCGVFVFVSGLVLLIFGILCGFFYNRITHIVFAALGAAVFCFYIVYDTQQIVGGKHRKYQYSIDDYIFGALTLYLDVVNLFMLILSLTNASG